MLTAVKCGQFA